MRTLVEGETGFLVGVLTALLSSVIVLGSFFLAFAEGDQLAALRPSQTPTLTGAPTQTPVPVTPKPGEPTYTPSPIPSNTPTYTPTITFTPNCQSIPADWVPYTIQDSDTWIKLAQRYGITIGKIKDANCWDIEKLPVGYEFYFPPATVTPAITATDTPLPASATPVCVTYRPAGWVTYTIRPGDTLFSIARDHQVSPARIQRANCILDPDKILANQVIWVPYIAPSSTPQPSPTPQPSATHTLPAPTATSTPLPTVSPSSTPSPSPTHTPTTPTPTPSETPVPTTAEPTTVQTGTNTPTTPSNPTVTATDPDSDSEPPSPTPP